MIKIKSSNKIVYIGGLVAALLISIGAGYFIVGQGEDYSPTAQTRRDLPPQVDSPANQPSENTTSLPSTTPTPAAEISPPPQQTGELNALDLSLGVLSIDDPEEKVRQALGEPLSSKNDNYGIHNEYDALEVVIRNGRIAALVSQNSSVSTPRGIHDGSPAQEVFDKYGTNYESSPIENLMLYEYIITSTNGTPCWLRFAVRNEDNRVDYISARFVQ